MKAAGGAMAVVGAAVAGDMIAMWNGSHDENMIRNYCRSSSRS